MTLLPHFYNSKKGQSQDSIKSKNERQKKWSSVVQDCFFLQKHTKCLFVVCAFAKLRSYRQYWFGLPALWKLALGGGQEGRSLKAKSVGLNRPFFERGVPSFQCLHLCVLCACPYGANKRHHCPETRAWKPREGRSTLVRGFKLSCCDSRQSVWALPLPKFKGCEMGITWCMICQRWFGRLWVKAQK